MATDPMSAGAGPKRPLTERQLAQRRAAGASARVALRAKNDRPASGWPASGLPAMGQGWGGEAKGPGAGPEALPAARAAPRRTREEMDALADAMLDVMVTVALDPQTLPALAVIAAEKARNQILGTPGQREIEREPEEELGPTMIYIVRPEDRDDD